MTLRPFVLMNRRTGDLFEAYRVTFLDDEHFGDISPAFGERAFNIVVAEHHGWVVIMPKEVTQVPVFFNRKSEEIMFEVLGEL